MSGESQYKFFVGIDWGTEAHQVCLLDAQRKVRGERKVKHSGEAMAEFMEWLTRTSQCEPAEIAISIEVPRGAVVETLVERGFAVFSINPKQLDRFRDRHTMVGAKDDRRDAFVLADSLSTDEHCFRRVRLDDPLIIELREFSRADDDLREEANRLQNRLREQLHRFFPQMLELSPAADDNWLLTLLEKVPTPAAVPRTKLRAIERVLAAHRIRKFTGEQVLECLRKPALRVAPGTAEAANAHIKLLIPRLRLVLVQRGECAKRIEGILKALASPAEVETEGQKSEHRDVEILLSLPGVGRVVAATMLAEASQFLAERNYEALRAHAGVAPVTRQSGKRTIVVMRYGCNGRLRNAVYHWAWSSSQNDEHSRAKYAALRQRGQSHGRALRTIADGLLRILFAMLKAATLYDPTRPKAAAAMPVLAEAVVT
jgi:transposase